MNSSDANTVEVINSLKSEVGDISSKYGRVAAELQIMNEDLKYYKLLVSPWLHCNSCYM